MRGLAILLGFACLGYVLQHVLAVPLSGNVIGLILLVICLFAGWVKLEWIEDAAQFLLKHMLLLFAPVIVGTITYLSVIGANLLAVSVALIGTTFVVLFVTGKLTAWQAGREKEQSK